MSAENYNNSSYEALSFIRSLFANNGTIESDTARYPTIAHEGDAGMDLYSSESVTLYSGDVTLVKTGIHLGIPEGYFAMVTPRSSMGAKGIIIPNSPGIIDQSYPGQLKVILLNLPGNGHIPSEFTRPYCSINCPSERRLQCLQPIRTSSR